MPDIPVVEAVPVEATALVNGIAIAVPVLGVDAVPLIDAATAKALGAVNNFKVRQRTSIIEGVSQGLCETENIYDIFDASTGKRSSQRRNVATHARAAAARLTIRYSSSSSRLWARRRPT